MCRNIKRLYNVEPEAKAEEIQGAALQFVRKISGFGKPSAINQEAFDTAVADITRAASTLLKSLVTSAPPASREAEAAKAHARALRRFGLAESGR